MKQKEGDSIRRQTQAAQSFCKAHNLELVQTLRDEGISGFKGKNFSNENALGRFLRLVENGTVAQGSVLIVENMDRLSRQSILPCLEKFTGIINRGVAIGAVSQNKILDVKSITENPMELMMVLVEFMRSGNESKTKSDRTTSIIRANIERVKAGEKVWFGVFKPTWVTGLKDGAFILDQAKVKLVKEVFSLYLSGQSCNAIANDLNRRKVPTLRFKNGTWTNSTVAELIRNKNVIGWFRINGNEFDDYFPSIISNKEFQDAQDKLAFNVKNRGGSKYGFVRNLFKGLLFCAECGKAIETKICSYQNVKGSLNHYANYICQGVKQHTGCKNHGHVAVNIVELAIFESLLGKHPSSIAGRSKTITPEIADLEEQAAKAKQVITRLVDMTTDPNLASVPELQAKLTKAVQDEKDIKAKLETAKGTRNALENLPVSMNTLTRLLNEAKITLDKLTKYQGTEKLIEHTKFKLAKWHDHYRDYMQKTDNRMQLRNLMPNLFTRVTIKFGKNPKTKQSVAVIHGHLIEGKQVSCSITGAGGSYVVEQCKVE